MLDWAGHPLDQIVLLVVDQEVRGDLLLQGAVVVIVVIMVIVIIIIVVVVVIIIIQRRSHCGRFSGF